MTILLLRRQQYQRWDPSLQLSKFWYQVLLESIPNSANLYRRHVLWVL
jgi:hypothetical protein